MPFDFDDDDVHPAEQVKNPIVSVRGDIRIADFTTPSGPHRFGGALGLEQSGLGDRKFALHRVLTLSLTDQSIGFAMADVTEVPLVYGFMHDGCRLKYRVVDDHRIEMIEAEMNPRTPHPDPNWPYRDYPNVFPEKRFTLRGDGSVEPDSVHDLTWQGIESIDPAEGIVVIVPPSDEYGVSLWGEGDDELVQVVFEIDPRARTVLTYNQCS